MGLIELSFLERMELMGLYAPRKTVKDDCYWYQEEQDMNARLPFCKLKEGCQPIEPEDCENCENYHSVYKRINADRVRAMSDEELAEWVWGAETAGRAYGPRGKKAWLDWLKQEATND